MDVDARRAVDFEVIHALNQNGNVERGNVILFEQASKWNVIGAHQHLCGRTKLGRLTDRGVTVRLSEAARKALVKEGYDPQYGARPLRRVVQRRIENPLARRVLSGEVQPGASVDVDVNSEGELTFEPVTPEVPAESEAVALAGD